MDRIALIKNNVVLNDLSFQNESWEGVVFKTSAIKNSRKKS